MKQKLLENLVGTIVFIFFRTIFDYFYLQEPLPSLSIFIVRFILFYILYTGIKWLFDDIFAKRK